MTTPTKLVGCRVVVQNDILGTREEFYSPQTAVEAVENHGHIQIAKTWLLFYGEDGPEPIAVCIRQSKADDRVFVRWHVVGDPEAAWDAMKEVLADGGPSDE